MNDFVATRIVSDPQIGFYRARLVKNGPWVPARIWRECHCTVNGGDDNAAHDWRDTCDRYPPLVAEVDGQLRNVVIVWPSLIGNAISKADFDFMTADAEWCRQNAPSEPIANPRQSVDLKTQAPIF